ncbi:hypothetical protein CVO77_05055 [Sphingopyxis lindanitolerans]|uniref:EF-hand domain-containing protein n=1 Tax=Sphingopyxis lindanitolerans TaxID=2054227 RepID=A0A2S8B6E2_9SPHN|nr:EF-hand domain-containing protein [Sphingopyxis lindanitolerans]PQM27910.1 hypothetical protein CVO77_05055 [Sphingopyxis lindanitolerans]
MKTWTMIAAAFGVAMPVAASAQPPHDGGRMFAMMDGNGDGKLDKAEITKMAQMRAERQGDPSLASPERIDAFFKHLDANGDGFIDKGEMESMRKARAAPPPQDDPQDAPDDAS